MKVEIWSDVACPFCYIGKRHFEKALKQLPDLDIEITWKSFELDPNAAVDPGMDINEILAKKYNRDRSWAEQMNANMVKTAEEAGLTYDMENLKPTNTFNAHQLIQFAKEKGKQDEMEEILFSAYFTEGKHLGKKEVLIELGEKAGLDGEEINKILESNTYKDAVQKDITEAQQIGVQGVPFFYFNEKYGLSGAQPVETFVQALKQISDEEVES